MAMYYSIAHGNEAEGPSPMTQTTALGGFVTAGHDHARCVRDALSAAQAVCRARGARLTALRRAVLELVWSSHEPAGAYDILHILQARGRSVAPPTVYRALDFLVAHGLVHRIESLNAFVGCPAPERPHSGQFLICRACGAAAELADPAVRAAIDSGAERAGFAAEERTVEVMGLCPACRG